MTALLIGTGVLALLLTAIYFVREVNLYNLQLQNQRAAYLQRFGGK